MQAGGTRLVEPGGGGGAEAAAQVPAFVGDGSQPPVNVSNTASPGVQHPHHTNGKLCLSTGSIFRTRACVCGSCVEFLSVQLGGHFASVEDFLMR